jgi:cytochrome P450
MAQVDRGTFDPKRVEATIMLATFVRAARFALAPAFDPHPSARVFLLPRNGMPMRVTLRR